MDEVIIQNIIIENFKNKILFDYSKLEKVSVITTNIVFIYDKKLVFKKLKTEQSFYSELSIYKGEKKYSFRIPKFIDYFKDKNNFFWIILEFIDSESLLTHLELNNNNLDFIVKEVVSAIAEFEIKSNNQEYIGVKKWNMTESLEKLFEKIEIFAPKELIKNLQQSIALADKVILEFEFRPCFDAFLSNILIAQNEFGEPLLYYCDFDKAFRSVPMGEQLTHLLLNEKLSIYIDYSVELYSKLTNCDKDLVLKTLKITAFARALSALRDNSALLDKTYLGTMPQNDYKLSYKFLKYSLSFFTPFSEMVGLRSNEIMNIRELFGCIENKLLENHNLFLAKDFSKDMTKY